MPLGTSPDPLTPRKGESRRFPDNPAGADWEKMEHESGPFFLCHTNVGELKPNDVISCKELGPSAQVERLLRLGAISIASPEHEQAYREYLAGQPPKPNVEVAKDPAPADIPDSTRKVELGPGGGFNQPPKGADKK